MLAHGAGRTSTRAATAAPTGSWEEQGEGRAPADVPLPRDLLMPAYVIANVIEARDRRR